MDVESLRAALEQATPAGLGVAFLAGLVFSFNPVALGAIPVSLAYVTKAREPRTAFVFGSMFVIGIIATHAILGVVAGLGGQSVEKVLGRQWGLLLGPVLILLGLMWPGWLRLPIPAIPMRVRRASGPWGAFALGVPFTVAVCPFCTPALFVLVGVIAAIGSPLFGLGAGLAFALGRAIPIALGAWAVGALESLKLIGRYHRTFEVVGGVVLVLAGLYMLNAYFFWVPSLAA
jgi:cytochrome c-type biogenesis protein